MGTSPVDLNAEAVKLGFTPQSALTILRQAKEAGSDATHRANAKRRAKQANPNLTNARLLAAFNLLIHQSILVDPKVSDDERYRCAETLCQTYARLRQRDPSRYDDSEQLRLARSIVNSRAYQRRRAFKATNSTPSETPSI